MTGLLPRLLRLPGLAPVALLLGALCFAVALTPSLIPRSGLVQGVLAGASFAAGYLIGVLGLLVWWWLGLRGLPPRWREGMGATLTVLALALMIWALGQATRWQDALHVAMALPPVESARPFTIAATAALTACVLILLGRLFRHAMLAIARRLTRVMPERLALLLGFLAAVLLFNFIGNDVIMRQALGLFDASYQRLNAHLPPDTLPPADPLRSGSTASLIDWESLGREGRMRVEDPLDGAAIAAITGQPAQDPLRVYVGLGSAEGPQARAQLALAEAIRVGAFQRGTLVIATPTGTGWVDPAAMLPLEVLTGGDVATISVQYSYLPSWLALLTVPEYGRETAKAVFAAIHGHWRSLPSDNRPKLYLFGLSLGALNSDLSADYFDLVGAPHDGAFYAGPPFGSRSWRQITEGRQPGSPEWLPRFRDGSVVRFRNQQGSGDAEAVWGPLRLVYLQYASDPITFFSPSILWREPDWMQAPRGPDVIEEFRWLPLVTFLQVGFDVMTATTTPIGHGHVYSGQHYLDGWLDVLGLKATDPGLLGRLRAAIRARNLG